MYTEGGLKNEQALMLRELILNGCTTIEEIHRPTLRKWIGKKIYINYK